MALRQALNTRTLLVCAAIGVATGILGGVAGLVTVGVIALAPYVYGLVLGVHVLPGIIAQEVLRKPMYDNIKATGKKIFEGVIPD